MPIDLDDILSRIASAGTTPSGGGGRQGDGVVWMGSRGRSTQLPITETRFRTNRRDTVGIPEFEGRRVPYEARTGSRPGVELEDDVRTETEARGLIYSWWGTPAFDRLADQAVKLGLIEEEEKGNFELLEGIWQDAVSLAARFFTGAGRRVTPWQALDLLKGAGYGAGGGRGGYTGTRTRRDTQVDLTNPTDAKKLITDVLARQLGRAPTDDEVRTFTSTLHAAERANPLAVSTTTTYQDGEAVSSSSTRSGGVDGGQVLSDEVMELPEYGAVQSATTYFDALVSALASPV